MKLSWSTEGDLQFCVLWKKGQQLNYVRMGSTHTPGTLCVIPPGVFTRLVKIPFEKTLFSLWISRQNLPWTCKHPPQGWPFTSYFPDSEIIMEKPRWKDEYWERKMNFHQQREKFKCLFLRCIITLFSTFSHMVMNKLKNVLIYLGQEYEYHTIDLIF